MQAARKQSLRNCGILARSGRVALPLKPSDKDITDFPNMVLEDGDRLSIPHTPSTVSVVGDVYNPGSFIFEPRTSTGAYLEMAGKGKPQSDLHHAFVLRANGVVVAANSVNGVFTGTKFDRLRLYPGDQIVVPYKLPTGAFVRGLRDWTQISLSAGDNCRCSCRDRAVIYADQRWIGSHGIGRFARNVLPAIRYSPISLGGNPAAPLDTWDFPCAEDANARRSVFFSGIQCSAFLSFTFHFYDSRPQPYLLCREQQSAAPPLLCNCCEKRVSSGRGRSYRFGIYSLADS